MIKDVETKKDFDDELKGAGNKLVIVDFFATWCGPCVYIAPEIRKLSNEHADCVFLKVDVDKNAETSEAEGIEAMPTFKFYKKGSKVGEVVGADLDGIKDLITKHK